MFVSTEVNNKVKLIPVKENVAWYYGKLYLNHTRNVLKTQTLKTQLKSGFEFRDRVLANTDTDTDGHTNLDTHAHKNPTSISKGNTETTKRRIAPMQSVHIINNKP